MLRVSLMSWYRREPVRLVSYQNVLLRIEHHWFGNTEYMKKLIFSFKLKSRIQFTSLSPWVRANARNVSSLGWPVFIINAADETKFSCYTKPSPPPPHRRKTTVSLETYPLDSLCLFACLPPNQKKQYTIFKLFSWSYLLQMYQIDSATPPCTGQQEWTISPFCWPWLKGVPMSMPRDMLERLLFT